MNKTVLMIMGGAVVVAILVAMIVQAKLSPKPDKGGAIAQVEILVANKKLLTGERIQAENVRWQAWPETALYTGVIKKSDEADLNNLSIYDTPLRRDIEAGEPIVKQAVISDVKGGGNFLAASLGPGMRAVGLAVKAQTGVGGFVSPGDRVDVIMTYNARISNEIKQISEQVVHKQSSQTVLSNVRVLGVDQTSKNDGQAAKVAKTVTLEVDKEGAEILALAESMGELTLALRRLGEKDDVLDQKTPLTTDVLTSEVLMTLNKMVAGHRAEGNSVRVYSGNTVQNIPVRKHMDE